MGRMRKKGDGKEENVDKREDGLEDVKMKKNMRKVEYIGKIVY